MVLEKTLESPLDCKEIQPLHPKGDQSWVFPKKRLNPGPQQWKHGVLTTGLPENYLSIIYVLSVIYTLFLNVTLWFVLCIFKVSHILSNDMLALPESYNSILLFSPSHFLCYFYLRFYFSTCYNLPSNVLLFLF